MASEDGTIVGECRSHKWAKSGNYPQAKISTASEAFFYLSRANAEEKFLVFKEDVSLGGKSPPEVYVSRLASLMKKFPQKDRNCPISRRVFRWSALSEV